MSFVRGNIEAMVGYVPGEQPRTRDVIKLNTNENPYPPSPKVREAVLGVLDGLQRYPDPLATTFRETAARVLGVPADWIVACNGSDDALTILTRACVGEHDWMVAPTPSYPLYKVLAQIQGCRFEFRPFTDRFELPADFTAGAKLAFVPNPNSPTGTFLSPQTLLEIARRADGVLVVDEAYVEFAPASCVPLVAECERLVVTRSFSKSHGLAGVRFGYVVAQPRIVEALRKVKDSYNCDSLSIAAASAALADLDHTRQMTARIVATRQRLAEALSELGFDVTPSHANFVWVRRNSAVRPIYEALKARGIFIRYLSFAGYGDGLRISVGTDAEIDRLLEELRRLV